METGSFSSGFKVYKLGFRMDTGIFCRVQGLGFRMDASIHLWNLRYRPLLDRNVSCPRIQVGFALNIDGLDLSSIPAPRYKNHNSVQGIRVQFLGLQTV
jgi:hypothetical protein